MTKAERDEQIEYLREILDKDIEYDSEKERLVLGFVFNIITSKTVMNRYDTARFGNILENKTVGITECINYIGKKYENALSESEEKHGE